MKALIRDTNQNTENNSGKRSLNRKEKKFLAKKYGISMAVMDRVFKDATISYEYETFPEGTKVKLNYDRIMENTEGLSEKYLEFVEAHKDDVLTIEYDEQHKNRPNIFCFKEDDNPVKWLFSIHDLILAETNDESEMV